MTSLNTSSLKGVRRLLSGRARARYRSIVIFPVCVVGALAGCASVPHPATSHFTFPKGVAFVGDVKRPYSVLGPVRSKVDFSSMGEVVPSSDDATDSVNANTVCRNYYNKSVRELVKFAKKQGGDAVIDVKSIVFMDDGKSEVYKTPECSDDGGEGQILTQGVAVKWKGEIAESGTWSDEVKATPGPKGKDDLIAEKKGPLAPVAEVPVPESVKEDSNAPRVTKKKAKRKHRRDIEDERAEGVLPEAGRPAAGLNPADPRAVIGH